MKRLVDAALRELGAYARSGLYTLKSGGALDARPSRPPGDDAETGLLFVHGVAANPAQFTALARALDGLAGRVDAFAYRAGDPMSLVQAELARVVEVEARRSARLVLVGHSLGGVLLTSLAQRGLLPEAVVGLAAIASPLHGTTVSRLSPIPELRALHPESAMVTELVRTRDRLRAWGRPVLTIGVEHDLFVRPASSAALEGFPHVALDGVGHVGVLFDPRAHGELRAFVGACVAWARSRAAQG